MISYEIVKECLEILDLKYTELEDGRIGVTFFDEKYFPYQVVTVIVVSDESFISFSTRAFDYHPKGDLLMMANRLNCRLHSPACYIDEDGDVVLDRSYMLGPEVSPQYILNNVIHPAIYTPLDAISSFEMTDEEYQERIRQSSDN